MKIRPYHRCFWFGSRHRKCRRVFCAGLASGASSEDCIDLSCKLGSATNPPLICSWNLIRDQKFACSSDHLCFRTAPDSRFAGLSPARTAASVVCVCTACSGVAQDARSTAVASRQLLRIEAMCICVQIQQDSSVCAMLHGEREGGQREGLGFIHRQGDRAETE